MSNFQVLVFVIAVLLWDIARYGSPLPPEVKRDFILFATFVFGVHAMGWA